MIGFNIFRSGSYLVIVLILLISFSCRQAEKNIDPQVYQAENLIRCQENLTRTIVPDILSPPFASRVYAYPSIAAYEALVWAYPGYRSLSGQLNGLPSLPVPDTGMVYHYELAAITAFNRVAKKMVWTEKGIADWDSLYRISIKKQGIPDAVIARSVQYGNLLGDSVFSWSLRDNFKKTRSMTRYALSDTAGCWRTTPPDYASAVEPYWGTHRTFVLPDVKEITPPLDMPAYNTDSKSDFFKAAMEVYNISKTLDSEQVNIARFWDDNPNVSTHEGHLTVFNQKMTPGGHWLAIASKIFRMKNFNIMQVAEGYTLTSMALADAFISCWHWKFLCNTVRPITYINQYIDPEWSSFLQTPPFPEFPSGHSTISGAASVVLAGLAGNETAFTDSSELEYGLPVRSFASFSQAADEVSISRVYGGIHFRFACDNGLVFGRRIGYRILEKIKTKN